MSEQLEVAAARFQTCIEQRDTATAAGILDDDFALVLVHPTSATMPRTRWLEVLPEYRVHSYRIQDQVLDIDGDVAVMLQRVEMSATVLGEDRSGTFVITDVWRERRDGWRVWRRHSTPLAAMEMPGV